MSAFASFGSFVQSFASFGSFCKLRFLCSKLQDIGQFLYIYSAHYSPWANKSAMSLRLYLPHWVKTCLLELWSPDISSSFRVNLNVRMEYVVFCLNFPPSSLVTRNIGISSYVVIIEHTKVSGLSTSNTLNETVLSLGDFPLHCRMLRRFPCLYLLTRCQEPSPPSWSSQKCLQMGPHIRVTLFTGSGTVKFLPLPPKSRWSWKAHALNCFRTLC